MDVPTPIIGALNLEYARAREREMNLSNAVRYYFDRLLNGWHESVQDYFLRIMYPFVDPQTKQPAWNAVAARQNGTEDRLLFALDDTLDDLDGEIEDLTDETAEESQKHGYLLGLWLLASQGTFPTSYVLPAFALAAVFGGLTYRDRLARWRGVYRSRAQQVLRAQIRIGGSLSDTTTLLDALSTSFSGRALTMLEDEMYGQLLAGQQRAVSPYETVNLWLTQNDEKVCPICWPLHRTVTALLPIIDTHPRCRCWVVPLRMGASFTPLSFAAFAGRFQ